MKHPKTPCLSIILLALAMPCHAATLHVPATFTRIGDAIAAALPGDTVQVAAGTYSPSINGESFPLLLSKAIHLRGDGAGESILDAGATTAVVDVAAAPGGHISGFTITGGRAIEGAGLRIAAGSPEVSDCLILANSAFRYGSGIYVTGAAAPWIHHNVIWEGGDWDPGDGNDPHGIDLRGGDGLVEHNLVGRGVSNGIFIQPGSAPIVRNNILFENGTPGIRGRGICAFGDSGMVVAHNLFHGNAIAALVVPATPFVDVTAAEANDLDPNDGFYGNVDGDPLFVDPDADWHLTPGSPAIDAGDPSSPPDSDDTAADIGPFFFDQSTSGVAEVVPGARLMARPNPFRSSTRIDIGQSLEAMARILILDVAGRVVRGLSAGPSERTVIWDGRNERGDVVRAGVYFAIASGAKPGVVRVVRLP